ncbi:cache domain-containing sensor histidine kinase [Paenibacillus radicis (ex Xue et al. 2023)]|uniref:Cache domain-containing protein n=1 Tax=Paenibacillus radicis (ex Xue et al. 2023) TaxID=2972489 RepID=A0ABT1YQT5_9BACL|nr:sensor histidine kinase [Paenibacillus radicis (ex Xue et al. 2023)]MCR8635090.1 cache domain-containing protein [Paenibacillus radicis (ex Xue et al. 2023)]
MKKLNLYPKLFLSYLIVIMISLTSVGIFSYWTSSRELDQIVEKQLSQVVGNAVHHTDLYIRNYERSMVSLLNSNYVKRFIDLPQGETGYPYYELRKLMKELLIEPAFARNPEIADIFIISADNNAMYFYNDSIGESFNKQQIQQQLEFYRANTDSQGSLSVLNHSILSGQQNMMVTLVRQIRGLSSTEPKGILAVELRAAELSELWKGIDLGENGYFFIADENGKYVYHPDKNKIAASLPDQIQSQVLEAGTNAFVAVIDDKPQMFMSRRSNYGNWRLVVSMSVEELRKPSDTIRTTTIVIGCLTLGIALWLAYRFGRSITGPIRILKGAMRQTEQGKWITIPLPEHRDEITELMSRYNLMVTRLSELVDKVYQAELSDQKSQMERQKAELQSLQLQINPHFLYNTLETIVCYAVIRDSKEIYEIVKALAYMLRYSVQTNLEEITVANELKHVMFYLVVLKHRIGREFDVDVAIHPDYLLHSMVRLTLQPLIENAFQHAFADGVEDYHYIRIDAGEDKDTFWISVEDNGVGIHEAKLEELREKLGTNQLADKESGSSQGIGGIGIVNVHRRIQMVFGEQYGLQIESQVDRGTKLIMIMPASDQGKEG